jgi:ferredoxin
MEASTNMSNLRSFRAELETPEGFRSLECRNNEYIWNAAAARGIILPAMCHQGRCLTCAAQLLSGSIYHDRADAYFSQDELANFVLLCRALPRSNVVIRTHQAENMRLHRLANGLPAPYA